MITTAHPVYPNQPTDVSIARKAFSITWNPESDEIVVSPAKEKKRLVENPNRLDFVGDPDSSKSQSSYSINFENSQLRLKYLDGHRVQSIRVQ